MLFSKEELDLLLQREESNQAKTLKRNILTIDIPMLASILYLFCTSLIIVNKRDELNQINNQLNKVNITLDQSQRQLEEASKELANKRTEIETAKRQLDELNTRFTVLKKSIPEDSPQQSSLSEVQQSIIELNQSLDSLLEYKIKIRYISGSEKIRQDALSIKKLLENKIDPSKIEIEEVDENTMKNYWGSTEYEIRYDKQAETKEALLLQSNIQSALTLRVCLREATTNTPDFLSIFLSH